MTVIIKLDGRVIKQYECHQARDIINIKDNTFTVNMESYIDYIDDEETNSEPPKGFDIKF